MYRCNNCFSELDEYKEVCPCCGFRYGDTPKLSYQLFPGTELNGGRYCIGQVLGSGGFGNIYKAWDTKLEQIVAIKEFFLCGVVNRSPGHNDIIVADKKRAWEFETLRERFILEARITVQFNSEPDIINVYDYIEENNTAYIIMEFLDGVNLSNYMKFNGHFDVKEGIKICTTICNALEKIHSKGIIHRDISPDNIFMCMDNTVKIIDFGAAKLTEKDDLNLIQIIKPGFAPPEQYENVTPDGKWTDVYALGATLYYLITGSVPMESTNRKQTENDVDKPELPFPHEVNPEIPEYLSNAIMNAMEIDTQLRFKDVKQFRAAINKDKIVLSPKEARKRRKRKKYIGLSAAAAVIAVGVGISVFYLEKQKAEETLPDSHITMWYCMSGNEELDEAEANAYKKIIEDFNTSFDNVTIKLTGFMPDEYEKALSTSEEQPNLYEYTQVLSTGVSLSLDDVYRSEEARQCSVLGKAKDAYGNSDCLPLGFNAPVIFSNTVKCSYDDNKIDETFDIKSYMAQSENDIVFGSKSFSEALGNIDEKYDKNAKDIFLMSKADFFGGYTSDYYDVREALPAQYKLLYCDFDNVPCVYDNVWRANDNGKNENKAVIRLLEFMLNNNAQDAIHVQNKSLSLPVNDAVLDVFVEVHGDFEGFFENKNNYEFTID